MILNHIISCHVTSHHVISHVHHHVFVQPDCTFRSVLEALSCGSACYIRGTVVTLEVMIHSLSMGCGIKVSSPFIFLTTIYLLHFIFFPIFLPIFLSSSFFFFFITRCCVIMTRILFSLQNCCINAS